MRVDVMANQILQQTQSPVTVHAGYAPHQSRTLLRHSAKPNRECTR